MVEVEYLSSIEEIEKAKAELPVQEAGISKSFQFLFGFQWLEGLLLSMEQKRTASFRAELNAVETLVVDGIDVLRGRPATQKEFEAMIRSRSKSGKTTYVFDLPGDVYHLDDELKMLILGGKRR